MSRHEVRFEQLLEIRRRLEGVEGGLESFRRPRSVNHLAMNCSQRLLLFQLLGCHVRVRGPVPSRGLAVHDDVGLAGAAESFHRILEFELRAGGVGRAIRALDVIGQHRAQA